MKYKKLSTIEEIKKKTLPILARYNVQKAGVFGSAVRGETQQASDVDMLIDLREPIGLFEFVGLKQELENAFGRKVDLVEYEAIKPLLKERILKEEVSIL